MAVTQKADGGGHVPLADLLADVAGGNADTVQILLRNDDAGQLPLPAELPELFRVALSPAAEPEIIAADEAHGTGSHQLLQKILPGS